MSTMNRKAAELLDWLRNHHVPMYQLAHSKLVQNGVFLPAIMSGNVPDRILKEVVQLNLGQRSAILKALASQPPKNYATDHARATVRQKTGHKEFTATPYKTRRAKGSAVAIVSSDAIGTPRPPLSQTQDTHRGLPDSNAHTAKKPLETYRPNAQRSRIPREFQTQYRPYNNYSQIKWSDTGDGTAINLRRIQGASNVSHRMHGSHTHREYVGSLHPGIAAEMTKRIHAAEWKN